MQRNHFAGLFLNRLFTRTAVSVAMLLTGLVASHAASPDCTPPPSGLVAWWQAEGNASESISGSNGVVYSGTTFVPGEAGQGFSFNGSTACVMNTNTPPLTNIQNNFTMEFWAYPQKGITLLQEGTGFGTSGQNFAIFPTFGGIGVNNPMVGAGVSVGTNGICVIEHGDGYVPSLLSYTSALNGWVHVAVAYSNRQPSLYVNGVKVRTGVTSAKTMVFPSKNLGNDYGHSAWLGYGPYLGLLDEVSLYDRALASNEIVAIYAADGAGKCAPVTPPALPAPVITDFAPKSGANGTAVTISGLDFSPVPADNIVYFGAVRAVVTAASATSLSVVVPVGATYAPPTATVGGLTGSASSSFTPTFAGTGLVSASSFGTRVDLVPGSGPTKALIADLDGDGKPDLAVPDGTTHTVSIYRNISVTGTLTAGSFGPRVALPGAIGSINTPFLVVAADVDGDGKLDLVTTDLAAASVSVFRNVANPGSLTTNSFLPRVALTVGAGPRDLALVDLDRDGRPEIVTTSYDTSSISILKNIGSAGTITSNSFAARIDLPAGSGANGLAVADLDGDGKPDIATANFDSTTITLLRNISTPGTLAANSFAAPVTLAAPTYCHFVRAADLDGDGKPELILSSYLGLSVSVYRNLATPGTLSDTSFASRVVFELGARGHTISIGDVNGDRKPDIVVDCEIPNRVCIFQNLATTESFTSQSFAARVDLPSGNNAWGSSIGDLDGDGRPEIAFANYYDNTISFYQNLFNASPSIVQNPANQTVAAGSPVAFSVVATGSAPLAYQWQFNETPIPGATNSSYPIAGVQENQGGKYRVIVTNLFGVAISSNADLTVNPPPPCTPAPAGLAAWWQAEGNASESISGSNGVVYSGATFVPGEAGQGFSFNGSTACIMNTNTPPLTNIQNTFTMEFWAYPQKGITLLPQGGGLGTSGQNFAIFPTFGGIGVNNPMVGAGVSVGTNGICVIEHGDGYVPSLLSYTNALNGWVHVAVAYSNRQPSLYVNGVKVRTGVTSVKTMVFPSKNLGNDYGHSAWLNYGPYRGLLDEVSIYNRALASNEIAAIYQADGSGKCVSSPTILSVTPPGAVVNEGANVSFTATAVGSPTLAHQWQFGGSDLAGETNSTLSLSNVVYSQGGTYTIVVSNPIGTASSNVLLHVNRAPVADAGATDPLLISPNGSNTVAVLDGSLSTDPDGDPLAYAWFRAGESNAFATGVVAVTTLPLGANNLTLRVSDGLAEDAQAFAVEVITMSEAVERLAVLVADEAANPNPLLASLRAALASIDRSQPATAINQLEAFKNKVLAQVAPIDPDLANQLLADAQAIIDALNGGGSTAPPAVEITEISQGNNGKPHLKIKGAAGRVHIVETSTDMVNWVKVGVAGCCGGCEFEFDDTQTPDTGARFYRVVSPK